MFRATSAQHHLPSGQPPASASWSDPFGLHRAVALHFATSYATIATAPMKEIAAWHK